tara:strand:+ start:206 stop:427 length:222 start_codon:yes stop_codon:yes gene_type:complete
LDNLLHNLNPAVVLSLPENTVLIKKLAKIRKKTPKHAPAQPDDPPQKAVADKMAPDSMMDLCSARRRQRAETA